jgi:hypothetical protein
MSEVQHIEPQLTPLKDWLRERQISKNTFYRKKAVMPRVTKDVASNKHFIAKEDSEAFDRNRFSKV